MRGHAPLAGIKIVEFSGLGPTPFAATLLADLGAQIVRLERPGSQPPAGGDPRFNFLHRGRPTLEIDLRSAQGHALAVDLCIEADVLLEGFRPGRMEKLLLGPEQLCSANPRLIYARMTGWGQEGPLSETAGHDINYLAVTGALYLMGPHDGPPVPPLNLIGNFGGGGMMMVSGILAALVERFASGRGQVIDAAMVDGASLLMTQVFAWTQMGIWRRGRGGNLLDGSAYFYRCYETADGEYIAVGALEPEFHARFLEGLGLSPEDFPDHLEPTSWESRAAKIQAIVAGKTRAEWITVYEKRDACVSPVLAPDEAPTYAPNRERGVHIVGPDWVQPAPAPRFSETPCNVPQNLVEKCEPTEALAGWSPDRERIRALVKAGVLAG